MRVVIELVSGYCNSKCRWCMNQYDLVEKGMMGRDEFERFINLNEPTGIIPFSHGESLLHPEFNDLMDLALSNNYILESIHTNLALEISDQTIKTLAKFKSIIVNIGGINEVTHYKNMETHLPPIYRNINRLRLEGKNPTVKMVLNKINIGEKCVAESRGVKTYPVYFSTSDSSNANIWDFYRKNIDDRVPCRDEIEISGDKITVSPKTDKCNHLITTIRYNGKVQVCCRSRKQDGIVGDAFTTPIKEIIASERYRHAKNEAKHRRYIPYCQFCS